MDNFEDKLKSLEAMMEALNSDEVSLEKSVELYKNAINLIKEARGILQNAALTIKEVSASLESENGEFANDEPGIARGGSKGGSNLSGENGGEND